MIGDTTHGTDLLLSIRRKLFYRLATRKTEWFIIGNIADWSCIDRLKTRMVQMTVTWRSR